MIFRSPPNVKRFFRRRHRGCPGSIYKRTISNYINLPRRQHFLHIMLPSYAFLPSTRAILRFYAPLTDDADGLIFLSLVRRMSGVEARTNRTGKSQYSTLVRKRALPGTDSPAEERDPPWVRVVIQDSSRLPRPTSRREPTTARTIFLRKRSARMVKTR